MEGYLYQWRNYFMGWQKFYYSLDHCNLHQYLDEEAKKSNATPQNSLNISMCEIVVDSNTSVQFEIHKSDATWLYLKGETNTERQRWLQALGSAKACMLDTNAYDYLTTTKKLTKLSNNAVSNESNTSASPSNSDESDILVIDNKEEQEYVISENDQKSRSNSNAQKNDSSQNINSVVNLHDGYNEGAVLCSNAETQIKELNAVLTKEVLSVENIEFKTNACILEFNKLLNYVSKVTGKSFGYSGTLNTDGIGNNKIYDKEIMEAGNSELETDQDVLLPNKDTKNQYIKKTGFTFWTKQSTHFNDVLVNAKARSPDKISDGIETELYLQACLNYSDYYDQFGGTLFQPFKSDLLGNIGKVRRVFETNKDKYFLLKDILKDPEVLKNKTHSESPVVALTWMLRGMRVGCQFVENLLKPESPFYKDTVTSLDNGYQQHLMEFHNWAIKRMFRLGMKMCPNYDIFFNAIVEDKLKAESENNSVEDIFVKETLEYASAQFQVIDNVQILLP